MTLAALLEEVDVGTVSGPTDREISDLCYDSRRVTPGAVFFGLAGLRDDGARYARQAVAAGAAAVVVARGTAVDGVTVVEVEEPRKALAQAAARFHGHPERALEVVGVTGTNGKTTTTWMLESIFRTAGWKAGVIGTTGVRMDGEQRAAALTTPESPELFGLLREMVARGVKAVAIEVSSHALVQRRAYGLHCRATVFTNLSHDHLDYHGTMERYLDAKLMLFDGRNGASPEAAVAVVNADDLEAADVVASAELGGMRVITYGHAPAAHVRIASVENTQAGTRVVLAEGSARHTLEMHLIGDYNAWNAAAAFASATALGIPAATVLDGLARLDAVPGRLERVDEGQPFEVIVDYAHTPDALAHALEAASGRTRGRVLLVFGCGGDRDKAKRPAMGQIAARGAHRAWITNDNPRTESPEAIVADIRAGDPDRAFEVELDRRAAIGLAVADAEPGDVVLIAGKGHETTQTIGSRMLPFDDRAVAREALRARAARGARRKGRA